MTAFDRLDRAILTALQEDGRLSIVELSERVGLSPTACQRRVRALETDGVIKGYRAELSPSALGLGVQAFVTVSIERQSADVVGGFEAAIARLPAVRACYAVTGGLDYLLHVHVSDLEAFGDFTLRTLIAVPGVKDVRSSLVLDEVKAPGGFVVDHADATPRAARRKGSV